MAQDPSTPNQYFWWPTIGDVTWLNFFEWWVAGINKRRFLKKDVRYGTEMDDAVFCTSVCTFVYESIRKDANIEMFWLFCVSFGKDQWEQLHLFRTFIKLHQSTAVHHSWPTKFHLHACPAFMFIHVLFLSGVMWFWYRTLRRNDLLSASDNRSIKSIGSMWYIHVHSCTYTIQIKQHLWYIHNF